LTLKQRKISDQRKLLIREHYYGRILKPNHNRVSCFPGACALRTEGVYRTPVRSTSSSDSDESELKYADSTLKAEPSCESSEAPARSANATCRRRCATYPSPSRGQVVSDRGPTRMRSRGDQQIRQTGPRRRPSQPVLQSGLVSCGAHGVVRSAPLGYGRVLEAPQLPRAASHTHTVPGPEQQYTHSTRRASG
jgi:hypothetical protein